MSLFSFLNDLFVKQRSRNTDLKTVFDHYFFDLKYYLREGASCSDFSNLLNISKEKLDQISNSNYHNSFEMLINKYRYLHFIEEIESPINSNLSIESIMKLSGFESNENFIDFVETQKGSVLGNQLFNK